MMKRPEWEIHALLATLVLIGLYTSSLYNYLLFHSLVEIGGVLVAFVIFVLAWNTRHVQDNHYLLFLGIAFLSAGALELVHTFAYKGFGVFPGQGANLATQLWIAFRYVFSLSLLVAPLFITRTLSVAKTLMAYFVITSFLFWSIFLGVFPDCFVEGKGLTRFKIFSEYIIVLIFLASLGLLLRHRRAFDPGVLRRMAGAILASVASELSFTQYASVFGFANMVGHLFLLASVYLIYRAIIVTGVVEPSSILFRDLKLSEAALKESEAKYRSLFENMIDGFAYHKIVVNGTGDPVDYVFLEVNSAFERHTGLKRSDIIGKRVTEVLPGIENDPADWIGTYGRVVLEGKEARFEQYAGPLNKWYSVSAYSPMREYFVTVFKDVTDRKRAEEALQKAHDELETRVRERTAELARINEELEEEIAERRRAEAHLVRLASAVESAAEAIVITDAGGVIQYTNPAFGTITGYAIEEAVGRDLHFLDSGKQDKAFYEELREALVRHGVWQGRLINRKKDGTFYFEECTISQVKNPAGGIIHYISIKRDVTEKLKLEAVAESVNTMNNIGYVFSGVRHEIGNPINSAKMILSVLQHKLDAASRDAVRDYVDRALTEIGRVEDLLKSLRNFNMFETPELENMDMDSFLAKFLKLIAEDFGKNRIALAKEIQTGAERVYADPRALQQVLLNIVTNAADALAGREKPCITISVLNKFGRVLIRVADNGCGMTKEQQRDLFKPFYTSKPRGTGLGLVIVRKMLAKMNGDIEIASRPDQGTTVNIYLPEGRDDSTREKIAPYH